VTAASRLRAIAAFAMFGVLAGSVAFADAPSGAFAIRIVGAPPALESEIHESARDAERVCAAWYGLRHERSVTIEWVSDSETLGRYDMAGSGSVAGVAIDSESRILLSAPILSANPARLRPVVLHEMSHLFFGDAVAGAEVLPPRWLNEGIAMRISRDWDLGLSWRTDYESVLVDASAGGSLIPFSELDASFPPGPFFHLAYAQSLSFVEWLATLRGDDGLRAVLAALDRDLDPGPAFAEVYGKTLEVAQAEWIEQLRPRGWLGRLPSTHTIFSALWVGLGLLIVLKFVRTRIQLHRAEEGFDE
jgi:hypothetical protein